MATFRNVEEIKKDIIKKSESAIRVMQENVYQIINRFVKEYYSEFKKSAEYYLLKHPKKKDKRKEYI